MGNSLEGRTMSDDRERRPSAPRGAKNEKRWDEVLRAAADVFNERGYQAATLQDIGSRIGILKGSLYYYIETKEDLLFEIMRRAHVQGTEIVREDPAAQNDPPPVRLAALIRRWMTRLRDNPVELRIAENDLHHLTGPRLSEITDLRRQIAKSAYDIIVAGIGRGDFDPSVQPWFAANTLFRVLTSTMAWVKTDNPQKLDDVIDWYVKLFLDGLAPGQLSKGISLA